MSDTTNIEELSTEDKKKAINLQDLVYVKKYIDDNHYDKKETDEMIEDAVESKVSETGYTKEEIDNNHYTKDEINTIVNDIGNTHYNKTETDNTFYKRTDTVDNATNAQNAVPSDNGNYHGFNYEENTRLLKFGVNKVDHKKLVWEGNVDVTTAGVTIDITYPYFDGGKLTFDYVVGDPSGTGYDVERSSEVLKAPVGQDQSPMYNQIHTLITVDSTAGYAPTVEAMLSFHILNNHTIGFDKYGKNASTNKYVIKRIYIVY